MSLRLVTLGAARLTMSCCCTSDYGTNITFEGSFYCNFNTVILDCAAVRLGDGVLFGPNVHLYGGTHSVSITERETGAERALPIAVGKNTWVGGNVSIL